MPPSGIGVPVAATPGLVPQAEVLVVVALLEADADELLAGGELLELELDELELLQAARTPSESAASAIRVRLPGCLFMCSAFSWLTAKYSSERTRDVA
jgi:hypothetical protein